jgi:hypothetical protein
LTDQTSWTDAARAWIGGHGLLETFWDSFFVLSSSAFMLSPGHPARRHVLVELIAYENDAVRPGGFVHIGLADARAT